MKVNTFVKKVKEGQFNNAADMIKVWYIPIQTKHDIALRTLEKCSADNNGYFYVDDFEKKYLFFYVCVQCLHRRRDWRRFRSAAKGV